jgi:hypothetical protein
MHVLPRRRGQYLIPPHFIYIQPWAAFLSNVALIFAAVAFAFSIGAFILYGRARRREDLGP